MKRALKFTIAIAAIAGLSASAHAADPLPGLTAEQLNAFGAGQSQFLAVDTIATGLGPIFNDDSCAVCHASPIPGGFGSIKVTRFGTTTMGVFDPLDALGGSLRQTAAISPECQEDVPPEATIVIERITPGTLGLGLIEAIPDQTLLDLEDINGGTTGEISGRAHMVLDVASNEVRVGRFGWKSQVATLLTFSGDALLNEQGVTNRLFPDENAPNGDLSQLAMCDTIPDPEDGPDVNGLHRIDHMTNFMKLAREPERAATSNENGFLKFRQVGCADCHVPMLMTGPSDVAALNKRTVRAFSDFLLHELAPEIQDGIVQGDAMGSEMRTAPLWDAHQKSEFMHDGRATSLEGAILAHTNGSFEGEAGQVVINYLFLSAGDRMDLLAFIGSDTTLCNTGDVDLSGVMDGNDVDDFVAVLLNGTMNVNAYCAADMNQDDYVDGDDVDLFVAKLLP